jgi:hypothetical protein
MGKVVPCLIPYKSVFYLKFFYQDKASFLIESNHVCDILCIITSVMAPRNNPS